MKKYTQGRELTAGLGDTEEHISQSGRQNNGNHPMRLAKRKAKFNKWGEFKEPL